jgi:hypothetical protein
MIVDSTAYDEDTLMKVRRALAHTLSAPVEHHTITNAISDMQNAGILFRERTEDTDGVSDGYHTFGELYDHRRALTAVLAAHAASTPEPAAWRSKAHHPDDSPMFEGGYFIVGIELDTGTITYHYKLKHWDDFAAVPEVEHAPKWDGAAPADTVTRLLKLAALMAEGPFGQ